MSETDPRDQLDPLQPDDDVDADNPLEDMLGSIEGQKMIDERGPLPADSDEFIFDVDQLMKNEDGELDNVLGEVRAQRAEEQNIERARRLRRGSERFK